MQRFSTLILVIFTIISISSIIYIWHSEVEKSELTQAIKQTQQEVNSLQTQLAETKKNQVGQVAGITSTGTINGTIQLKESQTKENIIVCAQNKFTQQEICNDKLEPTDIDNKLSYTLEIPTSKYYIYSMQAPNPAKIYYSEITKCNNKQECENSKKILIEITADGTQENIDLYY